MSLIKRAYDAHLAQMRGEALTQSEVSLLQRYTELPQLRVLHPPTGPFVITAEDAGLLDDVEETPYWRRRSS
jgi:hypothetical protein